MSKDFIDEIDPDEFMLAFLRPLCGATALNANKSERGLNPTLLNRHTVLHGISTDYASKANSLKAISFLFFIATTIDDALTDID
ncbi:MAG: hypothetical protein ACOYXY_18305 [Thermodesulfobacteriota bacterium]